MKQSESNDSSTQEITTKKVNTKENHSAEKSTKSSFRKISTKKYVIAGVITFLIFSLGLTLGMVFEEQRYNWADDINQEQDVNYLSLQLQFLFLSAFENEHNCPVLLSTLQQSVDELSKSLSKILDFEKQNSLSQDDYTILERRYTLDNLRYWILADRAKESCDLDIVSILYFYSETCESCPGQGTILTYFKKVFGEQVLIFPINVDLKETEPMVKIATSMHDVQDLPTLIIEKEKYTGIVKKNDLQEIICDVLKTSPECS
jgi:hypothetical protein